VIVKTSIVLFALSLSTTAIAETKEFDLAGIAKVEVNNGSGNIKVTATESGKATVTATKKQFGEHCKMIIDKQGTTLFVDIES
jgi:hypothetical protein